MKPLSRLTLALFAAGAVSPALAGDASPTGAAETSRVALAVDGVSAVRRQARSAAPSFEAMSPESRVIAERIFLGQSVTPDSEAPLSLDQIAAAKQAGGWRLVFRQLKAGRLTGARDVDALLKGARRRPAGKASLRPARNRVTVVTTGSGRRLIFYRKPAGETRNLADHGS